MHILIGKLHTGKGSIRKAEHFEQNAAPIQNKSLFTIINCLLPGKVGPLCWPLTISPEAVFLVMCDPSMIEL